MIPKLENKFKQLDSIYQKEVLDFVEFLLSKNLKTSNPVFRKKTIDLSGKPKYLKASKYCGILKLKTDPVEIQKSLRNEWR